MAAGFRSLHAFWVGGAGAGSAPAGVRSMLAPWVGGAGAAPAATQPGYRSLLAPWVGGAGAAPEPPTGAGYGSLLAFWVGGAGAQIEVGPTPAPSPAPIGSPRRVQLPPALVNELALRRIDEDDVLLLLAWQIAAGLVH